MLRPDDAGRPLSVTELANEIRRELRPLTTVLVKGEVTGMKMSAKGHYGFTIRDAGAVIEAFIFGDTARRLPMVPEDGQEFIFRGRVDFWPQFGRLRLIVDYVEFDDVGKMRAQLEQLKRRLEGEGAFAPARKRPIPHLPLRVALVTSPTGAVIHDLQETIWERYPNMEILVYPAQVQGEAAPGSIAAAIARCNREALASVLVIARGGGSFLEMYAFNTEPVARAILASRIPVVTALGHTSDRTVADMISDAECRTPTEAGARVVPKKSDLLAGLAERTRRLDREVDLRLRSETEALEARLHRLNRETSVRLRSESEALTAREVRLRRALPTLVAARVARLERGRDELARLSPLLQIERRRTALSERAGRLQTAAQRHLRTRASDLAGRRVPDRLHSLSTGRIRQAEASLEQMGQRLSALSPEAVLGRGYSITRDAATGAVLRSSDGTAAGRRLDIRLASGRLGAIVDQVNEA